MKKLFVPIVLFTGLGLMALTLRIVYEISWLIPY